MSVKQFLATVGAYLTGWVIAQNLYQRLVAQSQEEFKREVAAYVVDEVEARLAGRTLSVDELADAIGHEFVTAALGHDRLAVCAAAQTVLADAIGERSYPRSARIVES